MVVAGSLLSAYKMYVNFIRDIKEAELEYHFHKVLQEMGIETYVQTNRGEV